MAKTALTFTVNNLPGGALARLSEAILFVAWECENDAGFGLTRLNKILFEADFSAFEKRGVPVTGVRYQRLMWGPAPRAMKPCLRELEAAGALVIRTAEFLGHSQQRVIPLREPNLSNFSPDDMAFLGRAIRESFGKTAARASEDSHRIEWKTRKDGDPIPYEAAWLASGPVSEAEMERTQELARELGW